MTWIDFKSGFALVGSLVVLAGSLDSRMRERKGKPEEPGGSGITEEPKRPEPAGSPEFSVATKEDVEPSRPFSFGKGPPPTASA